VEFGADIKAKSKGGYTALLFAVLNNRIETAKTLVKLGANIEEQAARWHHSAEYGGGQRVLTIWLRFFSTRRQPNASDPRGSTLHTLCGSATRCILEAAGLAEVPDTVRALLVT